MNTITLVCKQCQKTFEYPHKEYNRQTKKVGRSNDDFYCSRRCNMVHKNTNMSELEKETRSNKMKSIMTGNTHGKNNKKGKFTKLLTKTKYRNAKTGWVVDIDEDFLCELWEKQSGKCAITGLDLSIPTYSTPKTPKMASLDRINPNIGYTRDNVQFLAYSINMAKNDFLNEEIVELMKEVGKQR